MFCYSGETTALGEPRPGALGRQASQSPLQARPGSLGQSVVSLLAMGAGVGIVFGILGRIF